MHKRNWFHPFGFGKNALLGNTLNLFCFVTLLGYALVAISTKMGWVAANWHAEVGASYQPPNGAHYFGTDILGRSVLDKVLHGTEVAMHVGFVVALWTVVIGALFGILAGYFGGLIDACIVWLYTVVTAIPTMILLMVVAFVLGKGIQTICIALVITEWTETCRLVRGEVMRHKAREYMQAASAIGASSGRKIFVHLLPNMLPLIIYQFSLVFQTAIKYEVILSYLGMGIQNKPSWGIMISDAKTGLLRGIWWELVFATMAMFLLVLVFNILADALRDLLDPKLKGR
ncbi:Binding-protein-dependent transport system inner membrane component [Cardinium endosymbiont of Sogatella furcifera]|uniref:ABC transporter permease n=1 Tax=Cardinium endosymbiont of Sogatella furcifera TaxID=650378 RepID=UPI000E0D632B|nr:ABC transporter permease [Cardinium endosymbiont of Sogatella furcifera]AXI24575.1 Binding-protein-dependent transport system inner membrane component [Cardinium endosymbiont of Sogatella furcifera]